MCACAIMAAIVKMKRKEDGVLRETEVSGVDISIMTFDLEKGFAKSTTSAAGWVRDTNSSYMSDPSEGTATTASLSTDALKAIDNDSVSKL